MKKLNTLFFISILSIVNFSGLALAENVICTTDSAGEVNCGTTLPNNGGNVGNPVRPVPRPRPNNIPGPRANNVGRPVVPREPCRSGSPVFMGGDDGFISGMSNQNDLGQPVHVLPTVAPRQSNIFRGIRPSSNRDASTNRASGERPNNLTATILRALWERGIVE